MTDLRVDPEILLNRITEEQENKKKGKLKIFFGYAAGVGKTYAMLQAAQDVKKQGVDIVAGYVEPHARPQTEALLDGLEIIPLLGMPYKNIILKEFDLDGALKRNPALILVDELAHTNAPGCRHSKRYQDVNELLHAGIDVYTTVNVQHIESLNDLVASITGVIVQERIPDSVFDESYQVELVDAEPEELITRLHDGKIYRSQQAAKAVENFFTVQNLVALREIALRRMADRVNKLAEKTKQPGSYYTEEHILVCLSSSPANAKIIRTAARMANAFRGKFSALFVETSTFSDMLPEDKKRLHGHVRLAEQLGAKIETVYSDDVSFQIVEYARLCGISKIVLGRSNTKKHFLFGKAALTDRLIELAPNLDIYIIPEKKTPLYEKRSTTHFWDIKPVDMGKALLLLLGATIIGFLFDSLHFSESNIITVYILGVLLTAVVTTGRLCSMASSFLSVLVFNFFFTDPRFSFEAYDPGQPVTFLIMFLAAFITGSLTTKIKRQAQQSAVAAYRTKLLLETNQLLQNQSNYMNILKTTAQQLEKLLDRTIVYYPANGELLGAPTVLAADRELTTVSYVTVNEQAVAQWVYKNNKRAGAGTDTLGNVACLYLAIGGTHDVYGVIGIARKEDTSGENDLIMAVLSECALAMEKEQSNRQREEAALLAKNEQLRANLLRSISHDLRTPLTSISGNADMLLHSESLLSENKKKQIYADIYDDSQWLVTLVENLLSITHIDEGTVRLKREPNLIEEAITEALQHVNRKKTEHQIIVIPSEQVLVAKMDIRLIIQVLINIINNAISYTPAGSVITIETYEKNGQITVEIADTGQGIPLEKRPYVFNMFYTADEGGADSRRGLGLGLALCKAIIQAHNGEITVAANNPHGAIFRFTLPAEEVILHE